MTDTAAVDDPVVREIPVHLADILRGNIHVVQFPLRPVYRPMTSKPVQAKYKPSNSMLSLDYPLHTEDHYNNDDDMDIPPRLTLQSSVVAPVSNYAVGVFRDGQLHLTPVTSVLQMRPTMSHLDDDDGDDDHDMEAHPAPSSSNVVAAAAEEVQVQVVKRQSERALAAMQNSYAYKRSVVQSEKWTDLSINANEDDEFEQLFSDVETPVVFDVTPQAYLHALSYRQDDNVIALTKAVHVSRNHVIDTYKIPAPLAKTLLLEYAVLNPVNRLWRLKLPDDSEATWLR
ncbi:hypothetical protein B5M09_005537 [Aphanomyces astaci]|uniref:Uncharacterized protein n=1 Tax=Aphanomyces astaci TaxID=112090 RepID=A0A425D002_APHAT|nr:hypothetical protein B5M09_005537 [Aphanomyces astaci]